MDKEFVIAGLQDRADDLWERYRKWINEDDGNNAASQRSRCQKDRDLCLLVIDLLTVGLEGLSEEGERGLDKLLEPRRR